MLGASSRSAIHLMSAAKAVARLSGRTAVTAADVREMAPFVLRHRLILTSGTPTEVLSRAVDEVASPD
jgi:MoxR-like ATPase